MTRQFAVARLPAQLPSSFALAGCHSGHNRSHTDQTNLARGEEISLMGRGEFPHYEIRSDEKNAIQQAPARLGVSG